MALKFKYASKEEIPAEAVAHYVERDGAFYADIEGATEKAKADELRSHNLELRKQIETNNARFEGIDPEEIKQLKAEKQRLEEERQLKAGEAEKVYETRAKALKAEFDKQMLVATTEREAMHRQLTTVQIDQGVTTTATKRGLRPTAIPDITARARTVFKLVNGVPRAFEANGQTVRYGRDGVGPMTLEEWVDTQVADAPHLFESNAGGGAAGTPAGGGIGNNRTVTNPFREATKNITEQMKLIKTDPGLAARLKAAAAGS